MVAQEECINYAIEHNIDLKNKRYKISGKQKSRPQYQQEQLAAQPAMPVLGQNFNFGRSPSKTGVIVDQNSANSSFNLQTSIPVF